LRSPPPSDKLPLSMLTILHTADWHFGAVLYGQRRHREHAAFAEWFIDCVAREKPDVVLISGDIFDTTTPSHQAQTLYYDTIAALRRGGCPHIIVTGGNHDAPSLLNAIQPLVQDQGITIVGAATENPADEVVLLRDAAGVPQMIVCAVPYLRDRDVRLSESGQSPDDKHAALVSGIRHHYEAVTTAACQLRERLAVSVPIIGMGHLFVAGGVAGDGVRDLYVGTLSYVGTDIFSKDLDYVALGHLHVPQQVSGATTIRYSGSPIPMGFGEAKQQKLVLKVTLEGAGIAPLVTPIHVPTFQRLVAISGDWAKIEKSVTALFSELPVPGETAGSDVLVSPIWLDIVYTGSEITSDLRERIDAIIDTHPMRVLRVKNQRPVATWESAPEISLDDLTPEDVFQRCLEAHHVPESQRGVLTDVYRETLAGCLATGDAL
jgi:DNA repair protein SbcD/Mre11